MTPVTMKDIPKTTHSMPTIKVYGPELCPNCKRAMDFFKRAGIAATKVTIEQGDKNHRYVTDTLGYQKAPVIVLTFENGRVVHWSQHRMDMLMSLKQLFDKGITGSSEPKPAS